MNFADDGVQMKQLPVQPLPKIMHHHRPAPAPLNRVRKDFEKVDDLRRYGQRFSLTEVRMSGGAVFSLTFPPLLKFDEKRKEARIRANLRSLLGVKQAPGDTRRRVVCEPVNPAEIRAPFIHSNRRLYDRC